MRLLEAANTLMHLCLMLLFCVYVNTTAGTVIHVTGHLYGSIGFFFVLWCGTEYF